LRSLSVLILLFVAAGGPAPAQTPVEEPRPVQVFEESVNVHVVNLDAVVTDARGERVTGLTLKDFRLRIDGAETPITFFSEIDEKRRSVSGEVVTGSGDAEPAAEPAWRSRDILVFLDETTMVEARRNLVVRSLTRQLDQLTTGDQMAVVAFSGSRLEVLCEWTGDRTRLASVLAALRKRPTRGIRDEAGRRQMANDAAFMDEAMAAVQADEPATRESTQLTGSAFVGPSMSPFTPLSRFRRVSEAAIAAMQGLPTPHGRKMMMLFSEGFHSPAFARPVAQEANRLGYSLYPVDVTGLDTFKAQNDVERTEPSSFSLVSTGFDREINHNLQYMADTTGGKAALNSNRMGALERLVEDSASYYLLGFSPTWRGDDRGHEVELSVTRPGFQVRTRTSYIDASHRRRLSLEADAALLLGKLDAQPRLIVNVGEPASAAGIAVTLGVPVESLAFFRHENGFRAEAPIVVVMLDEQGNRRDLPQLWLKVEMKELPREGKYARFNFSLPAGAGNQKIVVTVHDAVSGEALWGEARLGPGPPATEGKPGE
jgi:VWFA-related protein